MKDTIQRIRNRSIGANMVALTLIIPTGALADGDTATIDGVTYEADDDASVTAGNVLVDITGNGGVADDLDDLVAAIKANQGDKFRVLDGATYAALIAQDNAPFDVAATIGNGVTLVEDAPDVPVDDVNLAAIAHKTAVAADVTAGLIGFAFGRPVTGAEAFVRTTGGVRKAHDGALAIDGQLVTLDNSGSTDFAATDVVTVVVTF